MEIERVEAVPSTQDLVHAWGEAGRSSGAVLARAMSAGRGARGNRWEAAAGGLWLSLLLRPLHPEACEILPLRVGLAVAGVLEALPGMPEVQLKWPNDLMITGRKVGGILCEARWRGETLGWVAVGVGLNVANPAPRDVRMPAGRLADHVPPPDLGELAASIAAAVEPLAGDPPELSTMEQVGLERRDWLRGRRLTSPVAGTAMGVTPGGLLRVRTPRGEERLRTGPVACA